MLHDKIYNQARELYELEIALDRTIEDLNSSKDELVRRSKQARTLLPKDFSPIHEAKNGHSPYAEYLMMMTEEPAVGFYFDSTVTYDKELANTGIDFLRNGFLNIPFPTILFNCTNYFPNETNSACALWVKYVKEKNVIYFDPIEENNEDIDTFFELDLSSLQIKCKSTTEKGWPELREPRSESALGVLCHFLMLINHPAYEKNHHDIPESVNRKRERKGKGRLNPYIYIRMKEEYKSRLSVNGYTVRPHWRRGHVRNLGDGRIIPVQACIVNFDGQTIPEKKTYIVN